MTTFRPYIVFSPERRHGNMRAITARYSSASPSPAVKKSLSGVIRNGCSHARRQKIACGTGGDVWPHRIEIVVKDANPAFDQQRIGQPQIILRGIGGVTAVHADQPAAPYARFDVFRSKLIGIASEQLDSLATAGMTEQIAEKNSLGPSPGLVDIPCLIGEHVDRKGTFLWGRKQIEENEKTPMVHANLADRTCQAKPLLFTPDRRYGTSRE